MQKIIFLFFFAFLYANTLVVDNNPDSSWFSTTACNGDSSGYYSTIQDAISNASDGDTILVCGGKDYEENISIEKELYIKSCESSDDSDCDGTVAKIKGNVYINGSDVNLSLLAIESSDNDGIDIENGGEYFFDRLNITSSNNAAIYSNNLYKLFLKESVLSGGSDGLNIEKGDTLQIDSSKISCSDSDCVGVGFLKFERVYLNSLEINTSSNGAGIWSCDDNAKVNYIDINKTTFVDIKNENICLNKIDKNLNIIDNKMDSGDSGIYIKDLQTDSGLVNYNKISNMNDYGIYIEDGDGNLNIYYNCFSNNDVSAYVDDNNVVFDDETLGNYWDDWSGSGSYEIEPIPLYDNHPSSRCFFKKPIIEFWMDECGWDDDNSTYEVINHGDTNKYSATSLNEANITDNGVIYRDGNFTSTDDYDKALLIQDNYKLPNNYTLFTWIKFPLDPSGHKTFSISTGFFITTDYQFFNIADVVGADNSYIYFQYNKSDDKWSLCVADGGSNWDCEDFNPQNLSGWHLLTFAVSKDNNTTFYLDGDENITFDKTPTGMDIGLVYNSDDDGSDDDGEDNKPNGQSIGAEADEFKIFDELLDADIIKSVYDNEKRGKNYLGSCRLYTYCKTVTPLEMEGGFVLLNNTYNNPTWNHIEFKKSFSSTPVVFMMIDTRGGNPASVRIKNVTKDGFDAMIVEPEGEDGPHIEQNLSYLAVNKGVHLLDGHYIEVGTISTQKVQGIKLGSGNDIGWDKIETDFKFCNPAVVSNIQTLNNEEGDIPNSYSKPWMTSVLEVNESGIYVALDASETTDGYPIDSDEVIGYMVSSAPFMGSFIDSDGNNIKFEVQKTGPYFVGWDNSCKKISFLNTFENIPVIAGWKDSRYGNNGGWFRRCYLSKSQIGFKVDEDKANDSERSHIPEVGAVFAFDGEFVVNEEENKSYSFDVFDTDRDSSDRNISTKIVAKSFDLTIASFDENGSLSDFNGSVCFRVIDSSGGVVRDWEKVDEFLDNKSEVNVTNIEINKSIKVAKIQIQYKPNVDENCPLSDANETNSTDAFAIRPDRFDIVYVDSNLKSKEDFNINVVAKNYAGDNSLDYNESLGNSYNVDYNQTNSSCVLGDLNKSGGDFKDGETNITLNYDNVGDLNITVAEINGSEFAVIDADDTPDSERLISSASKIVSIDPYRFDLNVSLNSGSFVYMDKELNKALIVDMNITAVNKDGDIVSNYNKECYAKNIEINISKEILKNNDALSVNKILYYFKDVENNLSSIREIDLDDNLSIDYDDGNFTTDDNGSTNITIYINVDRNESNMSNPFTFRLLKIFVTDENNTEGNVSNVGEKNFYYGYLILDDVLANSDDFDKNFSFVMYDENGSDTLIPNDSVEILVDLWKNSYHFGSDGNVTDSEIVISRDYNASNSISGVDVSLNSIANGDISFHIIRNDSDISFVVVHLLTPNLKWLWYSKYSEEYNISNDSTCVNHFCFSISWKKESSNSDNSAGSGDFEGTRVDVNSTNLKVKLYR